MRLESSLLYFVAQFRRMYVGEQSLPSSKLYLSLSERIGLQDHVMVMQMIITKMYNRPLSSSLVAIKFFNPFSLLSHSVRNLKYWSAEGEIVSKSLTLVNDLATG